MMLSSGAMIREARVRARLSQTDLAHRAGVAQSVISAYESDRREPGLRTLNKLIAATGHQLTIDVVAAPDPRLGLPDTRLGRRLRRRRRAIVDLAARHGARNVRVFGSVARGEDTLAQRHRPPGRPRRWRRPGRAGCTRAGARPTCSAPRSTSCRPTRSRPRYPRRGARRGDPAVSRRDEQRLEDIVAAADAITEHLRRGGLDDGLVFDAVRVRLIEIGEAVKAIDPALLAREPDVPGSTSPPCATTSRIATSTPPTRSSRPPSTTTSRRSWPRSSASSGRPASSHLQLTDRGSFRPRSPPGIRQHRPIQASSHRTCERQTTCWTA